VKLRSELLNCQRQDQIRVKLTALNMARQTDGRESGARLFDENRHQRVQPTSVIRAGDFGS
jgi:hypothetical protein